MPTMQNRTSHFFDLSNIDDGIVYPEACAPYNQNAGKCNVRNAISFCSSERQISDCHIHLDPTQTYTVASPINIFVSTTKNAGSSKARSARLGLWDTSSSELVEDEMVSKHAFGEHILISSPPSGGKPISIILDGRGATLRAANGSRYLVVAGNPERSLQSSFSLIIRDFNFVGFGTSDSNGGALSIQGVDNLILHNNTFTNCTGDRGGAVFVSGNGTVPGTLPRVDVKHCSFVTNLANYGGGYVHPNPNPLTPDADTVEGTSTRRTHAHIHTNTTRKHYTITH